MTTKEWKKEREILYFCTRCGKKFMPLGKILEKGKHYPAYTVKYKDGSTKEVPSEDEIKSAVCRDCAKEMFDSLRHQDYIALLDHVIERMPKEEYEVVGSSYDGPEGHREESKIIPEAIGFNKGLAACLKVLQEMRGELT